jgi:hypothetical protein
MHVSPLLPDSTANRRRAPSSLLRRLIVGAAIAVVLLAAALGIGVLCLQSYLGSDAFRHKVEAEAMDVSGATVGIQKLDFSLWHGVKLDGVTEQMVFTRGTINGQLDTINCSYSLSGLLEHRVEVNEVTITQPQILLTQQPPRSLTTPPASAIPMNPAADHSPLPLDVVVEAVRIVDGEMSVRDSAGVTSADLKGIDASLTTSDLMRGGKLNGTANVPTIALPQNVNVTNCSATFSGDRSGNAAASFTAQAFDGIVSGDFTLTPSGPSLSNISGTQLDMEKMGLAANSPSPTKLLGRAAFQSTWQGVETGLLAGNGTAQIANGRLVGSKIMNDLAAAFNIGSMSDPVIDSLTFKFDVAGGTTRFSNLDFKSVDFEITGSGVIDPQGNLNADMVLILHDSAFAQIPPIATHFFTKLPTGGASIPFQLSGTAAHPQSDLTTTIFVNTSKAQKTIKKVFDNLFK